jgi:ribosomal protein L16/L10AE
MLQPSRTKFRKQQRGKMRGMATRGSTLSFGDFALKAQGFKALIKLSTLVIDASNYPSQII